MRVSRRVDQAVDELVDFVKTEVARHPAEARSNYQVMLTFEFHSGIPAVDVCLTNKNFPRVWSVDTYSLYHFRPLIKDYGISRTLSVIDKAGVYFSESGIPFDVNLRKANFS